MTTMHLVELAEAIAALDIAGVTIFDLDQMPDAIDVRRLPVLGPSASEPSYLTDWSSVQISLAGNLHLTYTLNYTLYQAPVGGDRGLFKLYPAMVATAATIADRFNDPAARHSLELASGVKHVKLAALPAFGRVFDASAQQFHGATFALLVQDF